MSRTPQSNARELLLSIRATLGTLDTTFDALHGQLAQLASVGPTMTDSSTHIETLRNRIHEQEKERDKDFEGITKNIRDKLAKNMTERMRPLIQEQIETQITLQVKKEVEAQISQYISVPLVELTEESKRSIIEVKHAFENSEARQGNSRLTMHNLGDHLEVVLKPDGTKSRFYPANLQSLLAYDAVTLRTLLEEHGLFVHEEKERNLNRFIAHIGVSFPVYLLVPNTARTIQT